MEDVRLLRVVCREEFTLHSAERLLQDLRSALSWLDSHFIYTPEQARTARCPGSLRGCSDACDALHKEIGLVLCHCCLYGVSRIELNKAAKELNARSFIL